MELRIMDPDGFGLGFICLSKRYMGCYDEALLNLMVRISKEYLKWFSLKTVVSTLKILTEGTKASIKYIPEDQYKQFNELYLKVFHQYVSLETYETHTKSHFESNLLDTGIQIGMIEGEKAEQINSCYEDMRAWISRMHFDEPAECMRCYDRPLPLKPINLEDFNLLCIQMVYVALGQRDFPCESVIDFIHINLDLLHKHTIWIMYDCIRNTGMTGKDYNETNWRRFELELLVSL